MQVEKELTAVGTEWELILYNSLGCTANPLTRFKVTAVDSTNSGCINIQMLIITLLSTLGVRQYDINIYLVFWSTASY